MAARDEFRQRRSAADCPIRLSMYRSHPLHLTLQPILECLRKEVSSVPPVWPRESWKQNKNLTQHSFTTPHMLVILRCFSLILDSPNSQDNIGQERPYLLTLLCCAIHSALLAILHSCLWSFVCWFDHLVADFILCMMPLLNWVEVN